MTREDFTKKMQSSLAVANECDDPFICHLVRSCSCFKHGKAVADLMWPAIEQWVRDETAVRQPPGTVVKQGDITICY
jgi:hypothetical protein